MKLEHLEYLADALGLHRARVSSGNLISTCPFAQWTHGKGTDRKPSFGITIDDDCESVYNCFGCHSAGDLLTLVLELASLQGRDLSDLEGYVLDNEGMGVSHKMSRAERFDLRRDSPRALERRAQQSALAVYPEAEYDKFRGGVPRYALQRGIPLEVCKAWGLGHDKDEGRLAFPVRRMEDSALVGARGRTYKGARAKYFPLLPFAPSDFLYGEHMLRPAGEEPRICVVEGEIDVIKCWMAGFSAVGLFGSFASTAQRRKLQRINRPLLLLPDPDKAGQGWAPRLGEEFKFFVSVYDVEMPIDRDAGSYDDPAELREMILKTARIRL